MNVRKQLLMLAERIEKNFPQLPDNQNSSDHHEIIKLSIINDIQQRLAEMYAIIKRETADNSLNISYAEAMNKFPERVKSVFNLISTLALSIKTKLNINNLEPVFDNKSFQGIDSVCFDCFKIHSTLSNEQNQEARETFNRGIASRHDYQDYLTGYGKSLMPGFLKGQIMSTSVFTDAGTKDYLQMVIKARQQLDKNYKPNPGQFMVIASSSPEFEKKTKAMFKGIFESPGSSKPSENSDLDKKHETSFAGMRKGFLNSNI